MSVVRTFVLKEWFKHFFGGAVILLVLLSVANLISNLLRENVTARDVLLNYLIELPQSLSQIFPVSCLIASLFSINKLKNRNELTAIFAAGFSRRSYILTLCEGAIVVAIMQFALGAYIQPLFKQWRMTVMRETYQKFSNLQSQGLKASTIGSGRIWYKTDKYFFAFSAYDKNKNVLSEVSIYRYDLNFRLYQKVEAKRAEYIDGLHWRFINGREFNYLGDDRFPEIKIFDSKDGTINESPNDFKKIESDITVLDIQGLYDYIDKLNRAGINTNEYEVLFYERLSSPLVCIIFAILAGTLAFNPNRRSSSFGKSLIFVFVFVLVYWLVNSYTMALGRSSRISAPVACFCVPVVFTLYLAYYFYKHRRLR